MPPPNPPNSPHHHKKVPRRSMDIIHRLNPFAPRPSGRPFVPDDDAQSTFTASVPTPLPPLPASPATRVDRPSTGAASIDTEHLPPTDGGPLTEAQLEVLRYRTSTSTSSPRRVQSATTTELPPSQSSFLRSLTHHPSFSALKARSRRRKAQTGRPPMPGESKSANTTPAKTSPKSAKKEIRQLKTSKSAPKLRAQARLQEQDIPVPPIPDSVRVALYARPNSQFQDVVVTKAEPEPRPTTPGPFSSVRGDPPVLDGGMGAYIPVEEVVRELVSSPLPRHLIPNAPPSTPLAPTVTARGKQRQRRMMSSPPRLGTQESPPDASTDTPVSSVYTGIVDADRSTATPTPHDASRRHRHLEDANGFQFPSPPSDQSHSAGPTPPPPRVYTSQSSAPALSFPPLPQPYAAVTTQHPHPIPLLDPPSPACTFDALEEFLNSSQSSSPSQGWNESTPHKRPVHKEFSHSTYPDMEGESQSALDMSLLGAPSAPRQHGSTSPSNTTGRSSPFVHPDARRRLSLDAFGPPPYTNGLSLQVEQLEDLSVERSRQFEDDDDDDFQQVNNSAAADRFRATSLSTIKECSSRSTSYRLSSAVGSIDPQSPEPAVTSPFLSASRNSQGLSRHLRNLSAPPAPPPFLVTRALLEAQSEHTGALKGELVAAHTVIEVLKSEIVDLKVQLQEALELKEDAILDKENEIGRLKMDNEDLEKSLNEIRVVMATNEEDVGLLKSQNHLLEKRFHTLSVEMEAILAARQADTKALMESEAIRSRLAATVASLQKEVASERKRSNNLEASASSLRSSINSQESDHNSAITERDSKIAELSLAASAKDAEISHLEQQLYAASLAGSVKSNNAEVENLIKQYEELQAEFIEKEAASQASREELAQLREQRQAWEDDRQAWEEERDELIERVWRLEEDEAGSPDLKAENHDLQQRVTEADFEIQRLEQEAEYNQATLAVQAAELEELRQAVATAEDDLLEAQAERDRVKRDSERALSHLQEKLRDKEDEGVSLQSSLRVAIDTRESERLRASGAESRVGTFQTEIDRLKRVEAVLNDEIAGLRRASAKEGLQRVELRKRIDDLIAERDLLTVSLDSKEIELAISRRPQSSVGVPGNRLPASAVKATPSTSRLSSSVSSTRVRSRSSYSPTGSPASTTLTPSSRHNVGEDATPRARTEAETPMVTKLSRGASPSLETPTTRPNGFKPPPRKAPTPTLGTALSSSTRGAKPAAAPAPTPNLSRRGSLQAVGRVRRPASLHE